MINDALLIGLTDRFNNTTEIHQRAEVISMDASTRRKDRPHPVRSVKLAEAKADLQTRFGIAEPVAHRLIQRFSMECRISIDTAADMCRLGLMSLDYLEANPDGDPEE